MALAQPTNLTVQSLAPVATLEQGVQRTNPAATVATLQQYTGGLRPARTVATLSQQVVRSQSARTVATLRQRTGYVLTPAHTVAVLSQRVVLYNAQPARTVAMLAQAVRRVQPARTVARLRQVILREPNDPVVNVRVSLNGQDVSARVRRDIRVNGAEGDAKTATLRLSRFPQGPIDVPGYQGQSVTIGKILDGQLVPLFTGHVVRPVWNHQTKELTLHCSDLRHERIADEDQARLRQMTGGLYSEIAQQEGATGADWVAELMKTVPGSLDYTAAGVLRYSPWAVGTPEHVLGNCDIHRTGVSFEYATRDVITNRLRATLEYRYFQRNTLTHSVQVSMDRESGTGLPKSGHIVPTKEAIRSALTGIGNWNVIDYSVGSIPDNGWYRDRSSAFVERIAFSATEVFRQTRAMGGSATLERYISQPKREVYEITIEAPESIDQFGAIEGSASRVSAETRIDGSIFEERGCTIVADPDDRRDEVELAMRSLQRQAEKRILAAHRQNHAEFRSRGDVLPVEIGTPISAISASVEALGTVTEFQHVIGPKGDDYTSIKLAVSLVSSGVSVSEDWALPAPPSKYKLNADSQALPETPDCPAPTGEAEITGPSRIEPDGSVIIVTPAVDRGQVDEIIGTRTHTYNVAIPRDTLAVEVT
ncbi:hypothetical protein [Halomonas getboli]|uniref:hypothetical protein n=1 Tax=Halomonas getboli TaxID=2935862 RepID=UPI001FFF6B6D|nr:hypothetical protein [Halomonas getboli]MCK2183497.1 hypothetical protein [Halomonas getboli]